MRCFLGLVMALTMIGGESVLADTFVINNTGVNVSGGVDQSWQLVNSPYGTNQSAFLSTNAPGFPYNGYWTANNDDSSWIQPLSSSADHHSSDSIYRYQTSFDLTGFDPTSAQFSFRMSGDNEISQVLLNGNALNFSHIGYTSFSNWLDVNNGALFLAGINSLVFEVKNYPQDTFNPSSLRVEFANAEAVAFSAAEATEVPEPASLAIWGLMTALGSAVSCRRIRQNRAESLA